MSELAGGSIWIDGALAPADALHLSAFDRGFQLGDGVFETLRARAGRPTELDDHLDRLRRSAAGLDIALAPSLDADVRAGIVALLAANGLDGEAGRRLDPDHGQPRGRHGARVAAARPDGGDGRDPGVAGRAAAGRPPRAGAASRGECGASRPGEPARGAEDDQPRRLRLRAARGAAGGRRRRAVPHDRRANLGGDERERVHRPRHRARDAGTRLRDPAGHDPDVDPALGACGRPRGD